MNVSDLWMESTRRYHERRREEHRWEWVRHFDRMAESHARVSEDYRRRADELAGDPTRAPARGDGDACVTNHPTETEENKV